jgi:hypothetical protein
VTGRGRALQRWTAAVAVAYALESVLLMTLSLHPDADGVDFASVVVEDVAESVFISLLLAIAAGFSITRPSLGPHRAKVVLVPLLYCVTALTVDLTEEWAAIKGVDVDAGGALSPSGALVFNICQVVALVALLLAWVMIFDVVARERAALSGGAEGIVGAGGAATGARAAAVSSAPGHAVALPPDVEAAARERGSDLTDVYAVVSGDAGADEGKTAADVVEANAKRAMLGAFVAGVTAYVGVRAAAILVPLVVLSSPDQTDAAVTAIVIAEDAARWLFLAALAWIFRPRPDSPYLMVGEGGGEVTTELGVMRGGGAAPSASAAPGARLFAGPRSDAAPAAGGVDGRFALGEGSDSDYGDGGGGAGGGGGGKPRRDSATHEIPL